MENATLSVATRRLDVPPLVSGCNNAGGGRLRLQKGNRSAVLKYAADMNANDPYRRGGALVMGPALLGSFRGSGEKKRGRDKSDGLVLAEQLLGVFFLYIHERLNGSK